jgi:CBS domain-containing protein
MSAQHITVSEVMTRDVVTVRPDTPFKEIASVLSTHGLSAVPVADERGAPMGLVSETDLLRKQAEQPDKYGKHATPPGWPHERAKARAENAAGLMTTPVVTAHADWPVGQAARTMDRHRVRRLLVVDDKDRIIGIASRSTSASPSGTKPSSANAPTCVKPASQREDSASRGPCSSTSRPRGASACHVASCRATTRRTSSTAAPSDPPAS